MDEVDDFLEHFGVKGMQWGVRRAQSHKQGSVEKAVNSKIRKAGKAHRERKAEKEATLNALTPHQRQTRDERNKMLKRVGVGLAVGAGGAYAAHLLTNNGKMSARNTIQFETHMRNAAKLRQNLGSQKIPKNVTVPKVKPKISPDAQKFVSDLSSKMRESVKLANEDLRQSYERTQTPLPLREYLKNTW